MELVALMPVLAAVCLGCWQGVVAAQCWWLAGVGARAAARAEAVGKSPAAAGRPSSQSRVESCNSLEAASPAPLTAW